VMGSSWGRDRWLRRDPEEWSTFPVENAMAADDKGRARPGAVRESAGAARTRGNDRPFDLWLQKQLHAMYDEIASEPLPSDLLNLIDKDADEDGASAKPGSPPKKPSR